MNRTFAIGAAAFLTGAALLALIVLGLGGWEWPPRFDAPGDGHEGHDMSAPATEAEREILYWRAPMDPNFTSDRPGKSPMGMDLVPVYADEAPAEREILHWRAPMDPNFISDRPGKSPMGMDLVPVYADEAASQPEGTVRIDPSFVQRIGVRTAPVERRDIAQTIRTVGTLAHNDKQIAWINTKFDGWIENVAVNYLGETVEEGQVLFDIYSPQLVTTQNEYLQAVRYAERLDAARYPDVAARAHSLVESARARLRFWDVTDEQIESLEEEQTPRRTLAVVSPVTGVVVDKMDEALDGMYVRPGMNLYKVADLTTIWVDVEIFEHQVQAMRIGQRAEVELPYVPGRPYTGFVRFLYPHFNQETRTMTVSIELANPDLALRAGMYANVTFDVPVARNALAVPEEAVIRSGTRELVVLELSQGLFRVAEVTLGASGDGVFEVRDGVGEGDRIVVSAQFLIDSESNLTQAIRALDEEPAQEETVAPAAGMTHDHR
ncbi:MAG: efflux RND transporter periplasmic adaptor subunit [Acidobacteriota bacterium]|nr:efflux RND transporter periplasmic adaptor subunit [Acidobacteriota bacterium]